jgi:hypothetical protein
MNRRQIISGLLLTCLLISFAPTLHAQAPTLPVTDRQKLEGTWLVTATFTDPAGIPPFKVLFTFMPGRSDGEGTLLDTNENELTPNPVCTPDQGVWERRSAREFIATHLAFCFDETSVPPGNPAGHAKVRDLIRLSKSGEEFDFSQYIEGFDQNGNTVFTGHVTGHGVRVHAEAPPQP